MSFLPYLQYRKPVSCIMCSESSLEISYAIKLCYTCLIDNPPVDLEEQIMKNHSAARNLFSLPKVIPHSKDGKSCKLCVAECKFEENNLSWCGMRGVENDQKIRKTGKGQALLDWYLDPQVTNCCNAWICPAGTGCGYPKYANKDGPEIGYYNMALFLYGCSFNCLFCQNYHHKNLNRGKITHEDDIVNFTLRNKKISCWCWFGGSPEPQLPFTIKSSRRILEETSEDRILRICYEWNGSGNPNLVKQAGNLALISGGNIKFDFKAFDPNVHRALTAMNNKRIKENIELIYELFWDEREKNFPVLGISTLLVPYYVNETEVEKIAQFLAELSPDIPYSLLIFHPDFMMYDLPVTRIEQVKKCEAVAQKYLNNVNIGNKHLMGYSKFSS